MSEAAFDPVTALRTLLDHDVRFVMIGGFAARSARFAGDHRGSRHLLRARRREPRTARRHAALSRGTAPRSSAGCAVPAGCPNAACGRPLHVQHVGGLARHPWHAVGDEGVRRPEPERDGRGGRWYDRPRRVDRGPDPHEACGRPAEGSHRGGMALRRAGRARAGRGLDRVAERSEPLGEIVELVVRVQTARVREDPEPCTAEMVFLWPEPRVASTEPRPVRADPEHGDEPRMQRREPILELLRSGAGSRRRRARRRSRWSERRGSSGRGSVRAATRPRAGTGAGR